ncbi:MAG: hypothetical protein RL368_2313 [Pseudomonadota bacterium]|jgi:outer membrane protein insertion porin family
MKVSKLIRSTLWGTTVLGACLLGQQSYAFDAFNVADIRLEGLRRISAGTVFNYLPVKVGEKFTPENASSAIEALFKTGLFKDVRLEREGNVLVVRIDERPSIAKVTFVGNKDIATEDLTKSLKSIGFTEGRVFNRSILEKVELELQRQYFNLGKYAVKIKSTVTPVDRNRVEVQVDVSEGVVAQIDQINFVGNQSFSSKELLEEIELSTGGWLSLFTKENQYSKQKLSADLETLRSFYLDRGYINFNIDSTQVSLTPDKQSVYLTINLTEGDKYTVSDVKLVGNLIAPEAELMQKVTVKTGNVFSRKDVTASTESITERIGDEGYAFANINAIPEVDNKNKTVALKFFIDPGKRAYVRRINYIGNVRTRDEVLRREMRQMEGGWVSTKAVKRSLQRLQRLNYFDDVNVETPLVADSTDQVDVNYTVVEKASGNLMAGVGYSQTQGVLFNASILQDNFLGSGKRIGLGFNNSKVTTSYNLSYLNPYSDIDGVSRGFNVFYRKTDAGLANLSRYATDVIGAGLSYGIPISEYNSVRLGFDVDRTLLKKTDYSAKEVSEFITANGDHYNSYRMSLSWARDTRNNIVLPNEGMLQSFGADLNLPFSDLTFYKVNFRQQWYYPIIKNYVFALKGEVAYGKGYGKTHALPFFENYTAGGPRTVRGFKESTLGPLDSNGLPLGGNLRVVGNAELILPPFFKSARSFRLSGFFDIGNVYSEAEKFSGSSLRYSTGIAAMWLSPIGALSFSVAKPLNVKSTDQTQAFQFSIGTTF